MNLKKLTRFVCLLLLLIIGSMQSYAQGPKITGKVIDQKTGQPLAGVSVKVKNSTQSTITDENGAFTIKAPSAQSIITFSFIGYAIQEVKAGSSTPLNISLSEISKELDEVVVVGYGTQKVKNVTGSIVSVNTKKMEDLPVSSISEMLRGQVPGLSVTGGSTRPGTMASVNIRQQFNWGKDGGNSNPLIVIDDVEQLDPSTGLPTLNTFNLLDLSEVESITVLRDASAAIYGARASQGAVIVKTKKGKAGAPRITYSGKFETANAISFGKVMNAQQYGIFNNRFYDAFAPSNQNNFFTPAEIDSMGHINYDWLSSWKAAGAMQHAINVSGGSDKATYFVGGSYYTQGANLGSQDFKRWTFRSGSDVKVASGLKLSAVVSANSSTTVKSFTKINISDAYANGGGEQADYAILLHMPKYIPWQYNINGKMQYVSPVLKPNNAGQVSGNNSLSNWNYYALLNNGSQTNPTTFNYNANFQLQYDIPFMKGLSVKGTYSIGSTAGNTEQDFFAQTLYQATNVTNAGSHLFTSNTTWNAVTNSANSRVTYDNNKSTIEQVDFYVNYDRSFGNHNITAVLVGEQSKYTYSDAFMLYNSPVQGGYVGSGSTAGTLDAGNSSATKAVSGTQSYLGRLGYNYKQKYIVQFILRSDASSKVAPTNYWGTFPSASVGWVISEEDFFKNNVSWVNNLKIRLSVGKTGNDNIKAWKWEQLYTVATNTGIGFGSNGGTNTTGLTPNVSPNPDVNWDKTLQRNLGLDVTLLQNRLTFNWDAYYNSSKNLITQMTGATNVPISVGGSFAEQNYANVNFWGTEMNAVWNDHIGKVSYTVGMNFALGNNKVTKYLNLPNAYPSTYAGSKEQGYSLIQPQWGYQTWKETSGKDGILRTDADVTNYWNYLTDLATKAGTTPLYNVGGSANITSASGMKKGMMAYQDQAGNVDATTGAIAGKNGQISDNQDYVKLAKSGQTYGITTNLGVTYEGFSLLAQIATSWGGYNSIDRVNQSTSSTSANWSQVAYLNDMYDTANNVKGKYPNIAYYSTAYVTSDFWKLPTFRCVIRSMSVGYTLPKQWLDRMHISSAKLVLSGNNLWDLYNPYPGKYRNMYDAANINYPTLRTWALGVNLGL